METGEIIKKLRKECGLSADELGKKIGRDRATVYRYEKGSIENVPSSVIKELAIALNTSPAVLLGTEEKTSSASLRAKEPESNYEAGVEHGRRETLKEISRLAGEGIFTASFSAIPVYSDISCGTGTWVDEVPEDYVGIPTPMLNHSSGYFSNRATGDSMEPGIHPGDYLVFEVCPEVPSGQIGAFSLNDRFYCKRFKRLPDGSPWLFSDNDRYDPIPIRPADTFRTLGIYKIKVSKAQ